jgi:hypothetical protein
LFTSIANTTASGQSDLPGLCNQCSPCTSSTHDTPLIQLLCWKFVLTVSRDSIAVKWLALVPHIWELWVQNLMGCALLVEVFMVLPVVCLSTSFQIHQLQITLCNENSWKKTVFYRWRISQYRESSQAMY